MLDKGLSFVTTSITQDHEGFMWFATTDGLYRYDSRSVRRYLSDPSNPASLPANYISAILSDSRNRLWTGSWKGLGLMNREKDTFTNYTHDPGNPASIGNDTILCVFEDSRKQVWIGTINGLIRAEDGNKGLIFTNFIIDSTDEYANVVRSIAEDENGDLWLGTSGGLVRFPHNGHAPERFLVRSVSRFSPENEISTLYIPGDGSIWTGMRGGGLYRFDPVSRHFERLSILVTEKHPNPVIMRFLADKQEKLWIATWEGLACYDPAASGTTWYVHDPADPLSLSDSALMDAYIDRQQGIWLGSYNGGVSYMNAAPSPFFPLFSPHDNQLAGQFADGWFGINKNNVLWGISDSQDRLLLFDEKRRVSQSYKLQLPYSMRFNHFFLDGQNVLWCGGASTFSRLDLKTGKRDDYPFFEQIKKRGLVRRILEIDRDRLLVLGTFGAFIFDRHNQDIIPSGISNTIVSGYRDPAGNTWLGGKGVVFRLDKDNGKWETIRPAMPAKNENDIWRITEDPTGRIWFVTGYGLWLFDEQARNFFPYWDFSHDFFAHDLMCDKEGFL